MAAALPICRSHSRSTAHLLSSRSLILSRPLLSSPLPHPTAALSSPYRLLATATTAASHPTAPQPHHPPYPIPPSSQQLSPSQLRAASAARAQQAVADAKAFEVRRARTLRNKNIALAVGLCVFVVWCYQFSVYSVRKSADSLTGSDVEEIERELDEEERGKVVETK